MGQIEFFLSIAIVVFDLAVVARLIRTGFSRISVWLVYYLIVLDGEILLLEILPPHSNSLALTYFFAQSANLVIASGAMRELYQLALAGHAGLAQFGRALLYWALAGAVVTAGLGILLDSQPLPGQSIILHRYFTVERTVNFVLLFLFLVIGVYLTWFPVKLRRNIVVYAAGFAVLFAARTVGLLVANLVPQSNLRNVSNLMLGVEVLCLIYWTWGFRKESEDNITITGHRWNPSEIDRLTHQLDSINSAIERFSRR